MEGPECILHSCGRNYDITWKISSLNIPFVTWFISIAVFKHLKCLIHISLQKLLFQINVNSVVQKFFNLFNINPEISEKQTFLLKLRNKVLHAKLIILNNKA